MGAAPAVDESEVTSVLVLLQRPTQVTWDRFFAEAGLTDAKAILIATRLKEAVILSLAGDSVEAIADHGLGASSDNVME